MSPDKSNFPDVLKCLSRPGTVDCELCKLSEDAVSDPKAYQRDHDKRPPPKTAPPQKQGDENEQQRPPEVEIGHNRHQPIKNRVGPLSVDEEKKMPIHYSPEGRLNDK